MAVKCWAGCGVEIKSKHFDREDGDTVMYCEKCKTKHIFIDANHTRMIVIYAMKENGTKLIKPAK